MTVNFLGLLSEMSPESFIALRPRVSAVGFLKKLDHHVPTSLVA